MMLSSRGVYRYTHYINEICIMCACASLHMCICMYVCMYVCMYAWMDGRMDGWMDVYIYLYRHSVMCVTSSVNAGP